MSLTMMLIPTPNGDMVMRSVLKGSNPTGEKHPMLRCPNCHGPLYYVYSKKVKNDILCFDMKDPQYAHTPKYFIRICKKCHHPIGVIFLTPKLRRKMNLPQQHECHEKIVI